MERVSEMGEGTGWYVELGSRVRRRVERLLFSVFYFDFVVGLIWFSVSFFGFYFKFEVFRGIIGWFGVVVRNSRLGRGLVVLFGVFLSVGVIVLCWGEI